MLKAFLLQFMLLILIASWTDNGYQIDNDEITFIYPSTRIEGDVFVCGNFMGWKKNDPNWRMTFSNDGYYFLKMDIADIKSSDRSFYEFTFLVKDELVDANPKAENVIHCAGYGYRYVIHW